MRTVKAATVLPRFSRNSSPVGLSPSTMSVTAFKAIRGVPNMEATHAIAFASISFTAVLFSSMISMSLSTKSKELPVDTTPAYIALQIQCGAAVAAAIAAVMQMQHMHMQSMSR